MGLIKQDIFVCLDLEMTGLDPEKDRIVEVACVRYNLSKNFDSFESLVDPQIPISEESLAIHRITSEMLAGKPKIENVLPSVLQFVGNYPIVGHGIGFDIQLLINSARRANIPNTLAANPQIDTLRLARYYGDSPNNSLESLALHFNVPCDLSHRAMSDVVTNIEVFKHLVRPFHTTEEIFNVLSKPIKMKFMPLGKHKGRLFSEIPLQYLQRAAQMDYDQDLLFSIRLELKRRKRGGGFNENASPFSDL